MKSFAEQTELRNFFAALTNLEAAKADNIPSIIAYHIDEIEIIHMHTASPMLKRRCAKVLAAELPQPAVVDEAG